MSDTDKNAADRIQTGGLLRCCTTTIGDLYPPGVTRVGYEGQALQCKYAPENPVHRMIFTSGAWQWDDRQQPRPAGQ